MSEEKDKKPGPVAEAIQSKFLEDRKVFLWGEVSDKSARDITEKLLHLEATEPGKEITFYINSPGGSITAGMAIYDTMQLISSPIKVVVAVSGRRRFLAFFVARHVWDETLTERRAVSVRFWAPDLRSGERGTHRWDRARCA